MTETYMEMAISEARLAADRGEVPVGAVVVHNRTLLAKAGNRTLELNDPTAHAEILAIRQACYKLNSHRLANCDLYVTLEPCTMCASAISFARIKRLYYSASDRKGGAVDNGVRFFQQPTCHHAPDVYSGLGESQTSRLLSEFFADKR